MLESTGSRHMASVAAACRLQSTGLEIKWCVGLVAPWHVGSSQTRDRTGVHCLARQSLNHWTTREAHTSILTSGGEAGSQIKTKQYNNGDDTFNSISYVSPGHRLTVHGVLPAEEKAYEQDRQITNKVTIPVIKVCCPPRVYSNSCPLS